MHVYNPTQVDGYIDFKKFTTIEVKEIDPSISDTSVVDDQVRYESVLATGDIY